MEDLTILTVANLLTLPRLLLADKVDLLQRTLIRTTRLVDLATSFKMAAIHHQFIHTTHESDVFLRSEGSQQGNDLST